jgi:hypothetical protein
MDLEVPELALLGPVVLLEKFWLMRGDAVHQPVTVPFFREVSNSVGEHEARE